MAVTHEHYSGVEALAARSVLLELTRVLMEYRDDIVLIGGWVPALLLPNETDPHAGSIDVDLALNHVRLSETGYRSIQQLLLDRAYTQSGEQPFIFFRRVTIEGQEIIVEVDFMAGEYQGTGRSHRSQRVQDMLPRKARGCDLAFRDPAEVPIAGRLPDGGQDSAMVRVASIVPFLVMKAMALDARLKEKDAYDIHYCLRHYPGGIDKLVAAFKPHLNNSLVQEALDKLREKFATQQHVGPAHVANFRFLRNQQEREIVERDAFELVDYLLQQLGMR